MIISLRTVAIATAISASALSSAQAAGLTIGFQGTQSNSVQTFSDITMKAFKALKVTVSAKGNATVSGTAGNAFSFPVTKIVVGTKPIIMSGSAVGSALSIERPDYDENDNDVVRGVTLANFTINYETKQVLADTTAKGGKTTPQMPLYNFTVATPLALKYRFPLTVTGHEVLNDLRLTPEAKAAMTGALNLPEFAIPSLNEDFGTLTQDINTNARKPAVSTTPYVAQ